MLNHIRTMARGESYWKVRFSSGKELSELDSRPYLDGGRVLRRRAVEWLEDIIGSGDLGKVTEAMLCTPQGTAHLTVTEPYTVFQFSRGTSALFTGERIKNMQCVGVVTNKDTGDCECAVWDQQTMQLYTMHNNVNSFTAWRDGIIDIGALNTSAMDLRGIGV